MYIWQVSLNKFYHTDQPTHIAIRQRVSPRQHWMHFAYHPRIRFREWLKLLFVVEQLCIIIIQLGEYFIVLVQKKYAKNRARWRRYCRKADPGLRFASLGRNRDFNAKMMIMLHKENNCLFFLMEDCDIILPRIDIVNTSFILFIESGWIN